MGDRQGMWNDGSLTDEGKRDKRRDESFVEFAFALFEVRVILSGVQTKHFKCFVLQGERPLKCPLTQVVKLDRLPLSRLAKKCAQGGRASTVGEQP